jgi:hypothetical protein
MPCKTDRVEWHGVRSVVEPHNNKTPPTPPHVTPSSVWVTAVVVAILLLLVLFHPAVS